MNVVGQLRRRGYTYDSGNVIGPLVTKIVTWQSRTMAHGIDYRGLLSCDWVLQIPTRYDSRKLRRPGQPRRKCVVADQQPRGEDGEELYEQTTLSALIQDHEAKMDTSL
jgi:hypothetical protein